MKIIIIEDEKELGPLLKKYLSDSSFEVQLVTTIKEAKELEPAREDIILLDWRLPDGEGIDLLREWRRDGLASPIIMMTARGELVDRVVGLELGANDYLTKPFDPRELLARIRVQLRGIAPKGTIERESDELQSAGIEMSLRTREVHYDGARVSLAKLEFDLLKLFLERAGEVLSRSEIMAAVWGRDNYQTTKTIDYHVASLRRKIAPTHFQVVHGIGYRFVQSSAENGC